MLCSPAPLADVADVGGDAACPFAAAFTVHAGYLSHGNTTLGLVLAQNARQILYALFFRLITTLTAASHDAGQVVLLACSLGGGMSRFVADDGLHHHGIHSMLGSRLTDGGAQGCNRIGLVRHCTHHQHQTCQYGNGYSHVGRHDNS